LENDLSLAEKGLLHAPSVHILTDNDRLLLALENDERNSAEKFNKFLAESPKENIQLFADKLQDSLAEENTWLESDKKRVKTLNKLVVVSGLGAFIGICGISLPWLCRFAQKENQWPCFASVEASRISSWLIWFSSFTIAIERKKQ
jgi:hypothetical protein